MKSCFSWAPHGFSFIELSLLSSESPRNSLISPCNFIVYVHPHGKPNTLWLPFPHQMPGNRGQSHQVKGIWGTAFGLNFCVPSLCLFAYSNTKWIFPLLWEAAVVYKGWVEEASSIWNVKTRSPTRVKHPPDPIDALDLISHGCWKALEAAGGLC